MKIKIRHLLLGLLGGLALLGQAWAEPVYSFSVAPQFERRVLFGIWQPVLAELQQRTGQRFELVTSLSVNDYDQDVRRGRYDFIYINPYLMLDAARSPGYLPLVRDERPLHGILVVRQDSPVEKVEELQGKTLAVPALSAMGASLLLRAELERKFGLRLRPVIAKTHSSVFLHVVNGFTDAGGSVQKALSEQDPLVRSALRVLYRTSDVASHPVAVHRRVPAEVREQVRQAFIAMSADPAGRALLARIPMQEAVAARLEDYQVMEELHLERYLQE